MINTINTINKIVIGNLRNVFSIMKVRANDNTKPIKVIPAIMRNFMYSKET